MTALRHRLHLCVAAWLILQVAALSAFVPQDCCAAHQEQHQRARHTTVSLDHSNHHSMAGHAPAQHTEHDAAPESPAQGCVMKGTCQGPMSAILAILSNQGVPPGDAISVAPDVSSTLAAVMVREHVTSRLTAPDPPPPRD